MKKKLVALTLILGLGAMSYSAFHMIYEKYPVIGTWRYEDNAAAITINFEVGEFSMKTFTGRMANMVRTSKEPIW